MADNTKQSYGTSLLLVGCLFFIFGFVTWMNGALIPFLKAACELNNFQAYFVTFAFYMSYLVMALPSSAILKKTGFKNGMCLGLLVMAAGTSIFVPAANHRNYTYFLTGLFVQGLGLAILQTAVNPYVTILGPEESAAKRISIMGIANKCAGILSPLLLASILLKNIDPINKQLESVTDAVAKEQLLNELATRIVNPYVILTVVLVILSMLIRISPLPELKDEVVNADIEPATTGASIFKHTYLFLGVIALFLYVGVEVISGDSIINYGKYLHIPMDNAKFFTSMTLTFMVSGYILGIALMPKIISQETALKICSVLAVVSSIGVLLTTGFISVVFLASLGFANSLMWPAIWPLSIRGLGKHTKTGAALLIMAISGGAVLSLLYGGLADIINLHNAYIMLLPCYLFILFFAFKGYKIGYKPLKATNS